MQCRRGCRCSIYTGSSTLASLLHLAPAGVEGVSLVYTCTLVFTGTGVDEDWQPVVAGRGKI